MLRLCRPIWGARGLSKTVKTTDYKINTTNIPENSVIFSMVQPTGRFHLGNYLGSVRVWKDLCDLKRPDCKLIFGVADLHAITIPIPNGQKLRQNRAEATASILSLGIDPSKAIIFNQSQVHQHAELHWLLSTLAPMGLLNRMTQWKSKSNLKYGADEESLGNVKLGLFSYPVLQAADILLYHSTHVPVGDDQAQHLELARTLGQSFNRMFKKEALVLPTTILAPTKRILSLLDPTSKMSKSDSNQNATIYLNEEPDSIVNKVKKAMTDSISHSFYYDPNTRPAVSNLINIVSGIQRTSISEVEKDISHFRSHSDFKKYVSEILVEALREPRENFNMYIKDPHYLEQVSKKGAEAASELAEKNLKQIKDLMGF
ncbi:LANO_0H23024g1_1 [Lachancea nothofagi CBS 11611]|uniref:Tryptophan--tRNA ligase, mitochondrial n=1 Tax=Lachancea nothofagi CBS 11611 TaxID=1266666 RepID=A0A1G4KNV2_9SACH|nr:LANO_0H23024g1_1 [Lachancea nothofagi CBS 11611]